MHHLPHASLLPGMAIMSSCNAAPVRCFLSISDDQTKARNIIVVRNQHLLHTWHALLNIIGKAFVKRHELHAP